MYKINLDLFFKIIISLVWAGLGDMNPEPIMYGLNVSSLLGFLSCASMT